MNVLRLNTQKPALTMVQKIKLRLQVKFKFYTNTQLYNFENSLMIIQFTSKMFHIRFTFNSYLFYYYKIFNVFSTYLSTLYSCIYVEFQGVSDHTGIFS